MRESSRVARQTGLPEELSLEVSSVDHLSITTKGGKHMNRIRDILNKHLFQGIFIGMLALLLLRTRGTNAALALSCGQWRVVPSQSTGIYPALEAVTAISAKNAWAVGYIYNSNSNTYQTLIEHWHGNRWSIVASQG